MSLIGRCCHCAADTRCESEVTRWCKATGDAFSDVTGTETVPITSVIREQSQVVAGTALIDKPWTIYGTRWVPGLQFLGYRQVTDMADGLDGARYDTSPDIINDSYRGFVSTHALASDTHVEPFNANLFSVQARAVRARLGASGSMWISHVRPVVNGQIAGDLQQPVYGASFVMTGSFDVWTLTASGIELWQPLQVGDKLGVDIWVSFDRPLGGWNQVNLGYIRTVHGVSTTAGGFSSANDTYAIDFGGTDRWTPSGESTWTFGSDENYTTSFSPCGIQSVPNGVHYPINIAHGSKGIRLTWSGEKPVLSFTTPQIPSGPAANGADVLHVMYHPRSDGTYKDIFSFTTPTNTTPQNGVWSPASETVFDVFSVRLRGRNFAYSQAVDYATGLNWADIADSVTVTRVNQ